MTRFAPITATGAVILCAALSLWLGAELLAPPRLIAALLHPDDQLAQLILVWRLPRVVASFLVGACLGIAGALFQGAFRNPLAEPYLLGSAHGAAVGATIALLVPLPVAQIWSLPILSFAGAWGATVLVVLVARGAGVRNSMGLLLAGVAISAMLLAVRNLLMLVLSDETVNLQVVISWTLGAIQAPRWAELPVLALLTAAGVIAALGLSRGLDVLGLGDDVAANMGLDVKAFLNRTILVAAAITAIAVCWGGLVVFVGLIVPHVVRWWVGPGHKRLILYSAVVGGCLLMLVDGLARSLLPPADIPLGLITALFGAPFFLFILSRENAR